MSDRRAWAFGCVLASAAWGCTGDPSGTPAGAAGTAGAATTGGQPTTIPEGSVWTPLTPCAPILDQRVTRLSDRHVAKALSELLAIPAPLIETGALSEDAFIPGKAAAVNGAVASKLQDVAEAAASAATAAGKALVACTGNEQDCAKAFIDDFASRAFRRPLRAQEQADLLAVYNVGQETDTAHAGGVSLVIETVLQSPSFLYLAELGTQSGSEFKLSGYETAAKLGLFLRDSLPDQQLWLAAKSGKLDTDAGVESEVDRLLADESVRSNLSSMFGRFFQVDEIGDLEREVPNWSALAESMQDEASTLISSVLWQKTGTLAELLVSRDATVSPALAMLYGVSLPAGQTSGSVTLPQAERAGILTRAGLMAARAEADSTSVVFRGLQVARGLLCVETPPPPASIAEQIEAQKAEELTERERAEKRAETAPCNSCHNYFDPFGVTFEHYDSVGKYRTSIATPDGDVAVDASQDIEISDISGSFPNAVKLAEQLSQSKAARECMSRQIASYAVGEKLTTAQACTIGAVAQRFEASGGDLKSLIKDVALWPALRTRKAVTP